LNSAARAGPDGAGPTRSQPRPTHPRSHPERGNHPGDEPSWHQLLGTLLSSQRTDAHPPPTHSGKQPEARFQSTRHSGRHPRCFHRLSSPFNLPGFPTRFVGVHSDIRGPENPVRAERADAETSDGRAGGCRPAGPAIEEILGVRSSLPGDLENITRRFRPASTRRQHRVHPRPAARLTCAVVARRGSRPPYPGPHRWCDARHVRDQRAAPAPFAQPLVPASTTQHATPAGQGPGPLTPRAPVARSRRPAGTDRGAARA
jgi:hypothetical protein